MGGGYAAFIEPFVRFLYDTCTRDMNKKIFKNIFGLNPLLRGFYLENHGFLDTRFDPSITARDVSNQRCITARLFHFNIHKQFLRRGPSSNVVGTKKSKPHSDA